MKKDYENYEVRLVDVSKKYGKEEILKDLNIVFKKNTINAILGPSGCGKTTLLNIISGLERVDSGDISFKGKDISYIFQDDRLIPWLNVYNNISFVLKSRVGKKEMDNIISKYLRLVKLEEHKNKFPEQLSGGMKRRVAIARAFAYKSDVLLMDEPFTGLDKDLKTDVIKEFLEIWREDRRTVILVTHDIEEAKAMTDKIYFL